MFVSLCIAERLFDATIGYPERGEKMNQVGDNKRESSVSHNRKL